MSLSITFAIRSIYTKSYNLLNHKNYYKITENSTCLCDIYIKNIKIKQSSFQFNDLSIMFNEKLNSDLKEIEFIAEIIEFGKLDKMSGHLIVDFISIDEIYDVSVENDLNKIMLNVNKLRIIQ
jgi:hypothetical protein